MNVDKETKNSWLLSALVVFLAALIAFIANSLVTRIADLESRVGDTVVVANSAHQIATTTSNNVDRIAGAIDNLAQQIAVNNSRLAVLIDRSSRSEE